MEDPVLLTPPPSPDEEKLPPELVVDHSDRSSSEGPLPEAEASEPDDTLDDQEIYENNNINSNNSQPADSEFLPEMSEGEEEEAAPEFAPDVNQVESVVAEELNDGQELIEEEEEEPKEATVVEEQVRY